MTVCRRRTDDPSWRRKYGSNGVQIYNNTMYWADSNYSVALTPTSNWEGSVVKDVTVSNNIFYGPAKADSVKTDGVTYSHNLVYGGAHMFIPQQ